MKWTAYIIAGAGLAFLLLGFGGYQFVFGKLTSQNTQTFSERQEIREKNYKFIREGPAVLDAIHKKAQANFPHFKERFLAASEAERLDFGVQIRQARLVDFGGIWLYDLNFDEENMGGYFYTENNEQSHRWVADETYVTFTLGEINDWSYWESGRQRGNFRAHSLIPFFGAKDVAAAYEVIHEKPVP